jgi:hypothetical protein
MKNTSGVGFEDSNYGFEIPVITFPAPSRNRQGEPSSLPPPEALPLPIQKSPITFANHIRQSHSPITFANHIRQSHSPITFANHIRQSSAIASALMVLMSDRAPIQPVGPVAAKPATTDK